MDGEVTEVSKELTLPDNTKNIEGFLRKNEIDLPSVEIDLGAAKEVLQALINTDQNSQEDLRKFFDTHSNDTLRQAMIVTAADVVLRHPPSTYEMYPLARKLEGNQVLTLTFLTDARRTINLQTHITSNKLIYGAPADSNEQTTPNAQNKEVALPNDSVVTNDFPYHAIQSENPYGSWAGYSHYENGGYKTQSSVMWDRTVHGDAPAWTRLDSQRTRNPETANPVSEDEYKDLFLGLRWQALNVLTWDTPGIRMPHDLPKKTVSNPEQIDGLEPPRALTR